MPSHLVILILLVNACLCCSNPRQEGKLELTVSTQELRILAGERDAKNSRDGTTAEITYLLTNNTNRDLMLYNFKRNFELGYDFDDEVPCDSSWQWPRVFVFTKKGDYVGAELLLHDRDTATHFVDAESFEKTALLWFRNGRVIVKRGESLEFRKRIDFTRYLFEKRFDSDTFYMKLDYVQYSVPDEITPDELKSDLDGATLFRGCLSSQQVRLIVGHPRKPDSIFLKEVEVKDSTTR